MAQLQQKTSRFACDQSNQANMVDQLTNATPVIWRGNDWGIEGALFRKGEAEASLIDDLTNIDFLTLRIRSGSATGTLLLEKVLDAVDLSDTTWAQWEAETHQHFRFLLSNIESNVPAGDHWLVIAITTNAGRDITVGGTKLTVKEDGIGTAEDFEPSEGIAYTKAESDARYFHTDTPVFRMTEDGPELLDRVTGQWRRMFLSDGQISHEGI